MWTQAVLLVTLNLPLQDLTVIFQRVEVGGRALQIIDLLVAHCCVGVGAVCERLLGVHFFYLICLCEVLSCNLSVINMRKFCFLKCNAL